MNSDDSRLVDLARRLLDGEAIDWDREGIAESEVREGMKRLQRILGQPARHGGGATETDDAPRPEPPRPPPPPPPPKPREERFIGDFRLVRKLGEGGSRTRRFRKRDGSSARSRRRASRRPSAGRSGSMPT